MQKVQKMRRKQLCVVLLFLIIAVNCDSATITIIVKNKSTVYYSHTHSNTLVLISTNCVECARARAAGVKQLMVTGEREVKIPYAFDYNVRSAS